VRKKNGNGRGKEMKGEEENTPKGIRKRNMQGKWKGKVEGMRR